MERVHIRRDGREKFLAGQTKQNGARHPAPNEIARILAQQDAQGRWLADGWIDTRRFIANMRVLSDYVRGRAASF